MTLQIDDKDIEDLVAQLAARRQITPAEAVGLAVRAELGRLDEAIPLRERFRRLREQNPLPPPTGLAADKTFFDALSGDL